MSGPRLTTAALIWRNGSRRIKLNRATAAWLLSAGVIAALAAEGRSIVIFVQWLRSNGAACAGFAAFFTAIGIAQRRDLMRTRFQRSWLAAVPVRLASARWEAFLMETLPAGIAVAVLCLIASLASLALAFTASPSPTVIVVVWAYLAGGVVSGVALSSLIPRTKTVNLRPGSRYVPKAQIPRTAVIRPSLSALGRWPIRQMFAWAQPKAVSRALIPVLVMMPLGTKADDAMIAVALFGTLSAMTLLTSAVIAVSRSGQRWLAPVPVRRAAIIRAILLPAWGVIIAASVTAGLLLLVFNVSYRVSAAAGATAAAAGCVVIAVALIWNTRPSHAR